VKQDITQEQRNDDLVFHVAARRSPMETRSAGLPIGDYLYPSFAAAGIWSGAVSAMH
jgi:hypothetical protein